MSDDITLTLSATFDPNNSRILIYTVVMKNESGATISSLQLADQLDSNLELIPNSVFVDGGPVPYNLVNNLLTLTLPDTSDGQEHTITFKVKISKTTTDVASLAGTLNGTTFTVYSNSVVTIIDQTTTLIENVAVRKYCQNIYVEINCGQDFNRARLGNRLPCSFKLADCPLINGRPARYCKEDDLLIIDLPRLRAGDSYIVEIPLEEKRRTCCRTMENRSVLIDGGERYYSNEVIIQTYDARHDYCPY